MSRTSLISQYLRINWAVWKRLPAAPRDTRAGRWYGGIFAEARKLVRRRAKRQRHEMLLTQRWCQSSSKSGRTAARDRSSARLRRNRGSPTQRAQTPRWTLDRLCMCLRMKSPAFPPGRQAGAPRTQRAHLAKCRSRSPNRFRGVVVCGRRRVFSRLPPGSGSVG
jgi:hypothetical protein